MNDKTSARSQWLAGHGPIKRRHDTIEHIDAAVADLLEAGSIASVEDAYVLLAASDRLTCAAMNVVAHMTYANRIDLSGAPLMEHDFKAVPEGHTGGSLNMVPAFVGYLLANALAGSTRGWLMGQGHCVAAIEAINTLTGDVSQARRDGTIVAKLGCPVCVRTSIPTPSMRVANRRCRWAAMRAPIPQGQSPKADTWASPHCNTCICPCRERAWWPS